MNVDHDVSSLDINCRRGARALQTEGKSRDESEGGGQNKPKKRSLWAVDVNCLNTGHFRILWWSGRGQGMQPHGEPEQGAGCQQTDYGLHHRRIKDTDVSTYQQSRVNAEVCSEDSFAVGPATVLPG